MKVEIFSGFTEHSLSKKINEFLNNNPMEVVDIKYSATLFYMGAMVIFKDTK